jgi:imidazoleglycerol-phosphate dehydratase
LARKAEITRKTRETDITVTLDLDGSGRADIETGIGFFDHMLEALAKHGAFDLTVRATGDLEVDDHHTMEDVGIVIGQCFQKALGENVGIARFGHGYVPMDEALARTVVDICNRPYLVWRVTLDRPFVGGVDTQLFKEFFHAFAMNSGVSVHVEVLYGENTHHMVEACYKSLARALRMAATPDERLSGPVSTKGVL